MPVYRGLYFAACLVAAANCLTVGTCNGQDVSPPRATNATEFPDLSIPANADAASLDKIIASAKQLVPTNFEQYQAMQTAIRDASRRLLKLMKGKEQSARYKQAELDAITASVSLMTNAGEEARKKTVEQVHEFLKGREGLSMADVQTGFMAAQMFELQPFKKPASDTYKLLDELLADDPREEMISFRINLQAAVRRLGLLGEPLMLQAKTIDGRPVRVAEYEGKFVLVSFFDTRNDFCRRETSKIKLHFEKYHPRGLEVIGISLDENEREIRDFVASQALTWPIIHDDHPNPLAQFRLKFGISKLPSAFLLNKEGTLVSLEAHGSELDRLMQMLFETPTRAAPPPDTAASATSQGTPASK